MQQLEIWQIALAIIAAYGIGLAKTGITGIGMFSVALVSVAMPGKTALGVVLPLLLCADCIAVLYYRRHAVWSHLWKLFPWAAAGIILGAFAVGRISDHRVAQLVGGLLLVLTGLQFAQKLREWSKRPAEEPEQGLDEEEVPVELKVGLLASGGLITACLGLLAGFATMVGNAAGPLMILYLLAARLPKMEFVGTSALYYFCLNVFKIPFSMQLGILTARTLLIDLQLMVFVIAGALTGRRLLRYINQTQFENLAMLFTALAGLRLISS